jgi:hypothetical protein
VLAAEIANSKCAEAQEKMDRKNDKNDAHLAGGPSRKVLQCLFDPQLPKVSTLKKTETLKQKRKYNCNSIGKIWGTVQQLHFHQAMTISLESNLQDRDRPMKKRLSRGGPHFTN